MSLLRSSASLPRHTAMLLSPWLIVGSALILGLAIAFWAVKNTQQERENVARNLVERAGALMWAIEGSARAGMGMQRTAPYLQYMLEEVGRQPDIVYLAVMTAEGEVVAHSDPGFIGKLLYAGEEMLGLMPSATIQWRFTELPDRSRMLEAYKFFSPWPGLHGQMNHERRPHGGRQGHMGMMHGRGRLTSGAVTLEAFPPGIALPPSIHTPGKADPLVDRSTTAPSGSLVVIVGLDMASFETALVAGERNTLFTALLVGMLGVGGFLSLFWAQSYKMSRRMLLDTRAFADEVIVSLPLGLVIQDASGIVSLVNAVAEKLLGCNKERLMGKPIREFPGEHWEALAERVRSGEPILEEEYLLPCSGVLPSSSTRPVPVSISASGIINDEGEVLGTLFLLRDLREVKRLQAELRRNERLSTLGNMAARVAHEIRNPLSSIKGFATYLGSRYQDEAGKNAARTMIGEVDRLNRVVSELLDFARPSNLNINSVELHEVAERAVRLARMDAEAKGVALEVMYENGQETVRVDADAERITQALLNILLNAIQATPSGGTVTLRPLPPDPDSGALQIQDTGKGMPPEVLSQVFSPYFTTRATGTGLGLSIVSKIIEDHRGSITMSSAPGEGTTVTIRLPLTGAAADV